MRRLGFAVVATVCVTGGGLRSETGRQLPADETAALWARAVAAKGGADTLRATRSVVVRWRSGRVCGVDLLVPPSHKWSWQDGRAKDLGVRVEQINLDDAVRTHQTRPSGRGEHLVGRIWPRHRREIADLLLAAFLETATLRPTPIETEPRGKDMLLRAEWDGGRLDYLFDPQARPKEVVFYGAQPDSDVRWLLRDYRRVGGLDLPHRIDEAIGGHGTRARRLDYELNPRSDPRALWVPPNLAAGPDGWARVVARPANDDLRAYEEAIPKGCGAAR
jgi:hypothetical protein